MSDSHNCTKLQHTEYSTHMHMYTANVNGARRWHGTAQHAARKPLHQIFRIRSI